MRIHLGGNAVADGADGLHIVLAQAVDLAHAETQSETTLRCRLKRAVPQAVIDIDLARLDAMVDRATHDLRRRIEAHGLGVEECRGKRRWVMAFEPGRDIDEMSEARGVALGEAILAEALDLVEAALGELCRIAARHHAAPHLLMQAVDGAAATEGGHGAAKLIRLGA